MGRLFSPCWESGLLPPGTPPGCPGKDDPAVRQKQARQKTPPGNVLTVSFFGSGARGGSGRQMGLQTKARLPGTQKAPPVKLPMESSFSVVPEAGLEPARSCPRQILSLMRLPFRHSGPGADGTYCITAAGNQSIFSCAMCWTSRRRDVSVWSHQMGVSVASPRWTQYTSSSGAWPPTGVPASQ